MNKSILNIEVQEFINSNLDSNTNKILLKGTNFKNVSTSEIVAQIEAKKRCKKKLPTWYNTENIYYPNKLNIEQTSSEVTAKYKSELIIGTSIIDTTGGFGVDCFYFSKRFETVLHCEINTELSSIVKHNFEQLKVKNIKTFIGDGFEALKNSKQKFDWLYIDPSRRHDTKGKVFFLRDCLPNVPDNLDTLFKYSEKIMVKASPLLDISAGIKELNNVKSIHIIAANNEVKELLWILEKDYLEAITIYTTNIKSTILEQFNFKLENETTVSKYSSPLTYLYEPNAAILKSGGFYQIMDKLDVFKLHQHSHLYTSNELVDFPGRTFKIETVIPYSKKQFRALNITKANVTTRNFPDKVSGIRKKLNIKDGGDCYLFFTTNTNGDKVIIKCTKL